MHIKLSIQESKSPLLIRAISHNIRYATSKPDRNERFWVERLPPLVRAFRQVTRPFVFLEGNAVSGCGNCAGELKTAFIGLQEVLYDQLMDIMKELNGSTLENEDDDEEELGNSKWAYIGVGRDDGKKAGEYGPILYQPNVVKLLHSKTIWLSNTPEKPSFGWDAACKRILTYGIFEPISTLNMDKPKRILVCNTHLDHWGSVSRRNSIGVILETIKGLDKDWNPDAIILTGDFNSTVNQEAYRGMIEANLLKDARECVSEEDRYGNEITYTGFGRGEEQKKIDYIWIGMSDQVCKSSSHLNSELEKSMEDEDLGHGTVEVLGFACITNVFDDGIYISDHRAIMTDIVVR